MKRLLLVIVALLCAATFTQPIQACQCREYGVPICARYWRSDAVFVGQVVDIKLKKTPDNEDTYLMITFMVEESFRGVSGPKVAVATATGTSCDIVFKKDKRYLVYATRDNETRQFATGMCDGSGLAVNIDGALNTLRQLKQRQAGESISGRVISNRALGLPGIKIELTSNDKTFETLTDKYGDFTFALPGPGSFRVRVLAPYLALLTSYSDEVIIRRTSTDSLSTFEYEVTLEKSECSYLVVDVSGDDPRPGATVTGSLLDATGQGVGTGVIDLINVVDTGPDYFSSLKRNGSFKFEKVAPGEYYIILNSTHEVPEEYDAPYARTYYPATLDKREAKKIQVTEGAKIENLEMRVGERMPERTVEGKAVWKNGRPPEDAYIRVYSGDKYVRRAEMERDGTFKFHLYGDFDYSIEAHDDIDEIEGRSQRVKIPQGDSAGHKLIIQRIKK